MLSGSINLSIDIDDSKPFYTNGDRIAGRVIFENSKPQSVQNIEIKLRCEEFAFVWVPNGQGGHTVTEKLRYLSLRHTVFPLKSLRFDPNTDSNARYTIQSGLHEFPFDFTIPVADRYPQTVSIEDSNSGIKWYLKAVVHRGQYITADKRAFVEFEMRPSFRLDYDSSHLVTESELKHIMAYLPGYAEWLKTPSARLKDMIPGYRHLRKKSGVVVTMAVPIQGLLQRPFPLNLIVNVECENSDDSKLLLLRGASLELKQKCIVSVNQGWDTSMYRSSFPLLELKNCNFSLKEGLDRLEQTISQSHINGRLPSTLTNFHFDIRYKIVLILAIASKEKPNSIERVRLSMPTPLHGFLPTAAEPSLGEAGEEVLPSYHQLPSYGECTVANSDVPVYMPPSETPHTADSQPDTEPDYSSPVDLGDIKERPIAS